MSSQVKANRTANSILKLLADHRDTLRAMGVNRIGLFGSFTRNEQSENSDVDLLFSIDSFTGRGGRMCGIPSRTDWEQRQTSFRRRT